MISMSPRIHRLALAVLFVSATVLIAQSTAPASKAVAAPAVAKTPPMIPPSHLVKYWQKSSDLKQAQLELQNTPQAQAVSALQRDLQATITDVGKDCGTDFHPQQADDSLSKERSVAVGDVVCVVNPPAAPMPNIQPPAK